jgi:hypothetical protein
MASQSASPSHGARDGAVTSRAVMLPFSSEVCLALQANVLESQYTRTHTRTRVRARAHTHTELIRNDTWQAKMGSRECAPVDVRKFKQMVRDLPVTSTELSEDVLDALACALTGVCVCVKERERARESFIRNVPRTIICTNDCSRNLNPRGIAPGFFVNIVYVFFFGRVF